MMHESREAPKPQRLRRHGGRAKIAVNIRIYT